MEKIIIFDTSVLRKQKNIKGLKRLVKEYSKIGDVFVPETVVDEITNYFFSIAITELIYSMDNNKPIYDIMNVNTDNYKFDEKQTKNSIRGYIKSIFNNNIISMKDINIRKVYERALNKIPPFNNNRGSDHGFKDTLIWISILKYNYSNYSDVLFIVEDNDFYGRKDILSNQFYIENERKIKIYFGEISKEYFNDEIVMVDNVVNPAKDKSTKDSLDTLLGDYETLSYYREEFESLLTDIVEKESEIGYGDSELKFEINKKIKINNFNNFKNNIIDIVSKNIMKNHLLPSEFLRPYIEEYNIRDYHYIKTENIVLFLQLMIKFEEDLPKYTVTFLSLVNDFINEKTFQTVSFAWDRSGDLPF